MFTTTDSLTMGILRRVTRSAKLALGRLVLAALVALCWLLAFPATAEAQADGSGRPPPIVLEDRTRPGDEEPIDADAGGFPGGIQNPKTILKPFGGGSPDAPAEAPPQGREDGKKKGIINRFVNFIRGKSDGDSDDGRESSEEISRKINELERFAKRNYRRSRLSETKKNLNDLITLKPYEATYHFALGLCFRKEGRFKDALKKYQDVLDLGGPKPLVHLLMAEALAVEGDKDKVYEQLTFAAVGGRNIIHDVQVLQQLAQYETDTEFIKKALSLEKYDIVSTRSTDPMTNPFPERGPGFDIPIEETSLEGPQDLTPEDQKRLLMDARKAYEKVLWYIKLEDEEKAMENYTKLRSYLEKGERITIPMIKNDFKRLESQMEPLEAKIEGIRLKFYYNQALVHLESMKQAFNDTEYNQVEAIFGKVKKLAFEMEKTNARYKSVADKVLKAGSVWVERTRVRQEFESSKPDVQGIILAPEARQAVINGQIIRQGEHYGDFKIQKVENNRITFRYKGETIPLVFRRY